MHLGSLWTCLLYLACEGCDESSDNKLASIEIIYSFNSDADSEITQYSTSCCGCLLIFGDKPSACKRCQLLCVPPFSCRTKRNHPSPRWPFGVGPSLPPLDSQDGRSKGSDHTQSGWREAPGANSEERPASEVQRSVVVSLEIFCSWDRTKKWSSG